MDASGIGLRALGDRAGVSHATISRLLRGMVLPDVGTLARLEVAMRRDLWPGLQAVQADADLAGRIDWSVVGVDSTSCRPHQRAVDSPAPSDPQLGLVLPLSIEQLGQLTAEDYRAVMQSLAAIYDVLARQRA